MIIREKELRDLLDNPEVQRAMAMRCEEVCHEWDYGLTPLFETVHICKWCGKRK